MILSAGLTPAWQHIQVFDQLRLGEVNRAREAHFCASGKVLNAGTALHHLGAPGLTLYVAGGSPLLQIQTELNHLGVSHRCVEVSTTTRTCTTILDQTAHQITELVEDARPLTADELDTFRRVYIEEAAKADVVVLIGSLPLETPVTFYRDLEADTPCPMVLDFRGEGLLSALEFEPLVIKPNRHELEQTIGRQFDTDEELLQAMRTLNKRGAHWVVVTDGPGAVWITTIDKCYRVDPPAVHPLVNPIGSGDAMAATIAWAVQSGRPVPDAVCLGLAAAAQNAQQLLPCRLDPAALDVAAGRIHVQEV